MAFKEFDLGIQLFIMLSTLIAVLANINNEFKALILGCLIFYLGMGIWQLISAAVHWATQHLVLLKTARKIYLILLFPSLVTCVYPILFHELDMIPYSMIVGFIMAGYYFSITIIEYKKARNISRANTSFPVSQKTE